jgi:hypothetical protein
MRRGCGGTLGSPQNKVEVGEKFFVRSEKKIENF